MMPFLMLSLPVGCATDSGLCAGWEPIRPTSAEVAAMSTQSKREIVAHNRQGEERGCWKP